MGAVCANGNIPCGLRLLPSRDGSAAQQGTPTTQAALHSGPNFLCRAQRTKPCIVLVPRVTYLLTVAFLDAASGTAQGAISRLRNRLGCFGLRCGAYQGTHGDYLPAAKQSVRCQQCAYPLHASSNTVHGRLDRRGECHGREVLLNIPLATLALSPRCNVGLGPGKRAGCGTLLSAVLGDWRSKGTCCAVPTRVELACRCFFQIVSPLSRFEG